MKRFLYIPFICLICIVQMSATGFADGDWLDKMDARFEETFVKSDAAFDRAMKEGVVELDRELESIWGNSRQLPDAKVWVGYSSNRKTRVIVDYEKGEISVEGFGLNEGELVREFQDILVEDSNRLDERDALKRKLEEKTRPFRRVYMPKRQPPSEHTKLKKSPEKTSHSTSVRPHFVQRNELARLVDTGQKPRFIKRSITLPKGDTKSLSRLTLSLRANRELLSAEILSDPVTTAAQKYNLPRSLILSVIKNESAFNPRARSQANALGLMQLVATSGGKEAYSFLMGQEATPDPEVLYDPVENIMLGATYLHLLNTRYFGKVTNATTRQYLIISAYNTGAGNVAKAFTGKMKLKAAIRKINSLSPEQVFDHLRVNLPYQETRTYLARVSRDTKAFANWDI